MNGTATLIANAGVLVEMCGVKILVDALHRRKTEQFSRVGKDLFDKIVTGKGEFAHIDLMLNTHDHPDHYDADGMRAFIANHPETNVLSPARLAGPNVYRLAGEEHRLDFGDIHARAKKLVHDGPQYAHIPNYGFVVEVCGWRGLFLGDAAMNEVSVGGLVAGEKIDAAFLNFPYVTLVRGKRLVREVIRPKNVVVFHLPFAEDDIGNYRRVTKYIVEKDAETMPPVRVLWDEGQEVLL